MKKEIVRDYLEAHFPDQHDQILEQFEKYYNWLIDENTRINLISRKTDPEDIWTQHFLDSILAIDAVDFNGKKILDFGTGGGFPGIPLAILYKTSEVYLLDSTKKKIQSVRNGAAHLGLNNCKFIDVRLEEMGDQYNDRFNIIASRSVRMTSEYKKIFQRLLKDKGRIVLYKSQNLEDVEMFKDKRIIDVSRSEVGERKIIIAKRDK
jgi:16S rRNA (guanine527-N7)-methyltransferase